MTFPFMSWLGDVVGFFWTVFVFLAQYVLVPIPDLLTNGFTLSAGNPFNDFLLTYVNTNGQSPIIIELFGKVFDFFGVNLMDYNLLTAMVVVIVLSFLLVVVVRIVSVFVPD